MRQTRDYSQAKVYLAKVLPWPEADDPPGATGIIFKKQDGKKFYWDNRACNSVDECVSTINWLLGLPDIRDIYVCMGSLSSAYEKTSRKGRKYRVIKREQEFVTGLKSLFMDLDAKGSTDGSYDTLKDALTAFYHFLKLVNLPDPSIMVKTGGGVHVYWTLNRILSPEEWQPLAEALVAAALHHGIKFDTGCTTDSVRVLRIPCTLNHKFSPPREVVIGGEVKDFDYSVERITQALAPFIGKPRPKSKIAAGKHIEDPKQFQRQVPVKNELGADLEDFTLPKPSLKELAKVCPFVRHTILTGGKDYSEPAWKASVNLAMWTKEGRASAHVMSMQHADYDRTNTNDKFDEAVKVQSARSLGWPQCQTVARESKSKQCQGCPHLPKGKSPLNFITVHQPVINGVAYTSSIGGMQLKGNIDIPPGYERDAAGYILEEHVDKEGKTFQSRVNDYIMVDPWISKGPPRVFNFTTETEVGGKTVINLATGVIGSPDMRKHLQEAGLMMSGKEVKQTGEFIVAWTKKLKEIADAVSATEPFGWAQHGAAVEGFAYGGTLYTPNGARVAPQTEHALASHYAPVGAIQPWYDAVNLVHSQKLMALDVIVASSFAAPLIRSTGQPGLLMSLYSLESGIGKTTAMQVAQAVWGDPVKAMQGLDDTSNSVLGKLGRLRHLPMFWDELKTDNDTRRMINTLFTVTRGREKSRMTQTAALRDMGSWETLMISASNESMVDVVLASTKMTGAGLYRLFEFSAEPGTVGRIAVSDASRIIAALRNNFGHAGQIYSQFLGTNFARVDQDVAAMMAEIGKEVDIQPDERFWSALVAVIICGATYANELGLTKFNLPKLREFMIDRLQAMRRLRDAQSFDMRKEENIANVLSQFLRDMRSRHTLVTDTMWMGRGKPKAGSVKVINDATRIDSLLVHAATRDKRFRVSLQGLNEWLAEKNFGQHVFIETLKNRFGATRMSASLGAGTQFSTGTEFVLDFDATNRSVKKFLSDLTS